MKSHQTLICNSENEKYIVFELPLTQKSFSCDKGLYILTDIVLPTFEKNVTNLSHSTPLYFGSLLCCFFFIQSDVVGGGLIRY